MNEIGKKVLSSYEKGILVGAKKTKGDLVIEELVTTQTLKNMLKTKITDHLADGTEVSATVQEYVVASALGDAIEKGSIDKVKTLMMVNGEYKDTPTEINVSLVDKDLLKRAIE